MLIKELFNNSSLPQLELRILLAFLLKKSPEFILSHPETKISVFIYKKFKILEKKRLENWPIAYLTGEKEFYNLNLKITPAVLTPRPETELIIDEIIENITNYSKNDSENSLKNNSKNNSEKDFNFKNILIIDLGTGSGAIIISLAYELRNHFPLIFKNTKFTAVDISATALKIAKQNAKKYQLSNKIKFYLGNLLDPFTKNALITSNKHTGNEIIISANLPYLNPSQIKKSPSISKEPRLALDGGKDGLKYYRKLFISLQDLQNKYLAINNKFKLWLYCEIDPGQAIKTKNLALKYLPQAKQSFRRDLSGRNRLFIIKII